MAYRSPRIDQAAGFDAAGNHDEAINQLAMATQEGDLDAMVRLGKRLLVGDRAPYLPRDGASMVFEAAHKGNPEALAAMSALQCIGVYQRKSWKDAFETLTEAARLGWTQAREQLLLLSPEPVTGPQDWLLQKDAAFWTELARRVDIDAWLALPPARVLSEAPKVVSLQNFIPVRWCEFFISRSAGRLKPALVYDPTRTRNYRSKTRTNSIAEFNLVENDFVHFLLQERMSRACGVPMNHMEGTAILNYQPGEEIGNHFDFVDPQLPNYPQEIAVNGQRIITFLVYLNDDYADGETVFPEIGLRNKGRCGEGLYFINALPDGSADLRTLHAGAPPAGGQKWIVSQFIRNRPVKYVQ